MATTTPNFGWSVPTSTDLVKDGATAIETLGDAIDASLVDLKGGTTGQILAKNSNSDMDFVWAAATSGDITGVTAGTGISGGGTSGDVTITNSMATAITTNGDLLYGTGSGTFTRLGIGSTGQYLSVTGGVPSWATVSSGAVIQVKSATYSTATSNTSATYADTGLSLSITPTSASNKVLVIVSQAFYMNRLDEEIGLNFRLMEGASAIHTDTLSNWQYVNTFTTSTDWAWNVRHNVTWLAAPATTSATTYKTQFAVGVAGSSPVVTAQQTSRTSTITLMEVTP